MKLMVKSATVTAVGGESDPGARALRFLALARERLDDVAQLPDDWDSYGAARPTVRATSVGHELLTMLWRRLANSIGEEAVPWMIAPIADGGVQIEWRGGNRAIEVEVSPVGQLNFLVEQDERTIRRSDPASGAPPDQVLNRVIEVIVGASLI
jgi:hypothetical protein